MWGPMDFRETSAGVDRLGLIRCLALDMEIAYPELIPVGLGIFRAQTRPRRPSGRTRPSRGRTSESPACPECLPYAAPRLPLVYIASKIFPRFLAIFPKPNGSPRRGRLLPGRGRLRLRRGRLGAFPPLVSSRKIPRIFQEVPKTLSSGHAKKSRPYGWKALQYGRNIAPRGTLCADGVVSYEIRARPSGTRFRAL